MDRGTQRAQQGREWVFSALLQMLAQFPFPILGIDSDNGSEFINHHLLAWCEANQITEPPRDWWRL